LAGGWPGRSLTKLPLRPFLLIRIPKPRQICRRLSRRRLDGDRKSNSALDRLRALRGPRRELPRRDPAAGVGRRLRAHPGRLSAVREAQGPPGQHARPIHPASPAACMSASRLLSSASRRSPSASRKRPWASCAPAKIGRKRQNFGGYRLQRRHRRYAALRHVVSWTAIQAATGAAGRPSPRSALGPRRAIADAVRGKGHKISHDGAAGVLRAAGVA
jgi:hypothetical protein